MKRRFIARKGFTAWTLLMVLGPSVIFPAYTAHSADRSDSANRELIETIRAVSDAVVVLGGSGFSILPEAYMEALGGDWGIRGEGEQASVQLLDALEQGHNPGTIASVVSTPGRPVYTEDAIQPHPVVQRWDTGLRPARDLFDYPRYIRGGGMGNIQTKRGCVFKCNYCTYPLLEGNRFRSRCAEDVAENRLTERSLTLSPDSFMDEWH